MDDQFNGRTDDDLFADEFEPATTDTEQPQPVLGDTPDVPDTHGDFEGDLAVAAGSVVTAADHANAPIPALGVPEPADHSPAPAEPEPEASPAVSSEPTGATDAAVDGAAPAAPSKLESNPFASTAPLKTLSSSRYAPKPSPSPRSNNNRNGRNKDAASSTPPTNNNHKSSPRPPRGPKASPRKSKPADSAASSSKTTDGPPPNAPKAPAAAAASSGTAAATSNDADASNPDRLSSGANPRTKLSDTELAQKMERMRTAAVERTRKFEQAQADRDSHAEAYERGMEEARRRRADDAERRRKADEERRKLDDERAANRERKLRAMGDRGATWDEGKPTDDPSDNSGNGRSRRAGFRGAHGGIRGSVHADDTSGGRLESPSHLADEHPGRGGGRGGRARGGDRGGRGGRRQGSSGDNALPHRAAQAHHKLPKDRDQTVPHSNDFPALPVAPKLDTSTGSTSQKVESSSEPQQLQSDPQPKPDSKLDLPTLPVFTPISPGRTWADEVDALDGQL